MSKETNKIVKINELDVAKSSSLSTYLDKTIETLKFSIRTIEIPKETVRKIIVILSILLLTLLLIIGNLSNTLNQQTSHFQQIDAHTELTADYQRHIILSDYIKTVENIITNKSQAMSEKLAVLRVMTQATLQELDSEHKRYLIMFLHDVNLLKTSSKKQKPLLFGASIAGAKLQGLDLRFANFKNTNLTGVDLRSTDLRGANLEGTVLTNACYNSLTLFNKGFMPVAAGMKEVFNSRECVSGS